jgi:hypothetical protein
MALTGALAVPFWVAGALIVTLDDPMLGGLVLAGMALIVTGRYGTSLRGGRPAAGQPRSAAPA